MLTVTYYGCLLWQVTKAQSLEHLNVGGTFITDVSVLAIARHCRNLKVSVTLSTFRMNELSVVHIFLH